MGMVPLVAASIFSGISEGFLGVSEAAAFAALRATSLLPHSSNNFLFKVEYAKHTAAWRN